MKALILAHAKALTALAATLLLVLVHRFGLSLDDATVLSLGSFAVAVLVLLVPNTPASSPPASTDKAPGVPEDAPTKPYGLQRRRLTLRELAAPALAVAAMLSAGCALFTTPKGALVDLHIAECVLEHVDDPPAQIAIKCGTELTPEIVDLITKSKAAAAKARACR